VRDVRAVRAVAACLDPATGDVAARRARFDVLRRRNAARPEAVRRTMAGVMRRFAPGLFVGEDVTPDLPTDNLALERWFRLPKHHRRHVHGHAHAGVALVVQGPSLVLALDAHRSHAGPFAVEELRPYFGARPPASQRHAVRRHTFMRRARSVRQRPRLLAELEARALAPD
jgi:hypothetical protein